MSSYKYFHDILRLLMFHQVFVLPEVKQCVIITYKHGINEFPHQLKFRILGTYER